jgi:hypothetical protein
MKTKNYNARAEMWSYSKLSKLKPVKINRDTEPRLKKVSKLLAKKYLPTHSLIIVGKVVKAFGKYKVGDYFRFDGNTRFYVYESKPELIPDTPFLVIIYDVDSLEDMKSIYYSIDSHNSVEKSNEKITGIHRYKDYVPQSPVIKDGKYKRAVEIACRYGNDDKGNYLQTSSFEDIQLPYYWDVITHIDKMGIQNTKKQNPDTRYSPVMFGCLLMVGKKYGVNHKRFDLMYQNFKNGITQINNDKVIDGVSYVYTTLYGRYSEIWSKADCYNIAKNVICTTALYCFDAFMRGENIPKGKSIMSEKHLQEFFQFYNERLN